MPKDLIHPLLSHQPKEELYKCIPITLFKTRIYFCSRCLGYWVVFIPTLMYQLFTKPTFSELTSLIILFILPIFTFADWSLTKLKKTRSHNLVRFFSANLLGLALPHALFLFLINRLRDYVLLSAAFYFSFFLIVIFFSKFEFKVKERNKS